MSKADDAEITEYLRRADAEVRVLRNLRNDLTVAHSAYLDAVKAEDISPDLYRHTVAGGLTDLISLVKERLEQAERRAAFN